MVKKVFFSFHYERDNWRANVVRQHWLTKPDKESAGYIDAAGWEGVKRKGDDAIKRWILNNLHGTSVTVVLIGTETSNRRWVKYEIIESRKKGNGILGIYIHNIKDQNQRTCAKGDHYFGAIDRDANGEPLYFGTLYKTYDWVNDYGYTNFTKWVEEAANNAGR